MPDDPLPKPLTKAEFDKVFSAKGATADNTGTVTARAFVAGVPNMPPPALELLKVGVGADGVVHYEVRVTIKGAKLGHRAVPPPMKGTALRRVVTKDRLREADRTLGPFVPPHLPVEPRPTRIPKFRPRLPLDIVPGRKYHTGPGIFPPDDRQPFADTAYPWSAMGRCTTAGGSFAGVLVGPRHVLTCNHMIDWAAPPGSSADWFTFTPAYYAGGAPFGTAYGVHVYWVDPPAGEDPDRYDYVVVVLNEELGKKAGWLGVRRYTDAWDAQDVWWHVGYPHYLLSGERPSFQGWFALDGRAEHADAHQEILHTADVEVGHSGGPMFGYWAGEVGPRAVAVQSWFTTNNNGASGGGDLADLALEARKEFP